MRTALVLAPYSPADSPIAALGAARKIRGVLAALRLCFEQVVLVNSAHNEEARVPACWDSLHTCKGDVSVYLPPRWGKRAIGKMRNLLDIRDDVETVLKRFPQPELVWVYNAYAYDALFLRELLKRKSPVTGKGPRVILEIEDWPLARLRKGHPKPWLDWAGMQFALRYADTVLCVNERLVQRVRGKFDTCALVFPGLVDESVMRLSDEKPPFQKKGKLCIGYFGGLGKEKGGGLLLEAIEAAHGRDWRWLISGSGPMTEQFSDYAKKYSHVSFHGAVSDEEMVNLMGTCDVIVNPHRSIFEMGDGVFPFKVVESVGSGRLVISTYLPEGGIPHLNEALVFFDGSLRGLLGALEEADAIYEEKKEVIECARVELLSRFSVHALASKIRSIGS